MRKNIDLTDTVVKMLGKLAKEDGRKTKNYIERVLTDHAFNTPLKKISDKIKNSTHVNY